MLAENKPKRKRVEREAADQAAVIVWARGSSNKWPELKLLYAIPNGRSPNVATRVKAHREGVLAGIPDLCLPASRVEWIPRRGACRIEQVYHALYIEQKSKGEKAEPHQVEIHNLLEDQGNLVCVCDTPEESIKRLTWYLELRRVE